MSRVKKLVSDNLMILCPHTHRIDISYAVHRLAASLALILHLSPFYVSQLQPLVDVLQAKDMLMAKLSGNESILTKKEVKNLVRELAEQLC